MRHGGDEVRLHLRHSELGPYGAKRDVPAESEKRDEYGEHGQVELLPAVDLDVVTDVVRAGGLLPEKATSFQPKPSLGSFIRLLDE